VTNLPAHDGMASIIIPCWNQLEFTRFCLPALVRHTRPPWELILIDNGSTDGTGIYLAGVQDVAPVPVTAVSNAQNLGFPAAINEGLKVARGDCLVLLNNDAVVTDGWLNQLTALAEMDSDLTTKNTKDAKGEKGRGDRHGMGMGLVGPMSNYASPPQPVENVPYANLDEMHAFARRWRDEHRGQWFTAGKLSGFCLHSGKSRSFPPGSASPTPSASAREVTRDTANPAPKMKRPCRSRPAAPFRNPRPGESSGCPQLAAE